MANRAAIGVTNTPNKTHPITLPVGMLEALAICKTSPPDRPSRARPHSSYDRPTGYVSGIANSVPRIAATSDCPPPGLDILSRLPYTPTEELFRGHYALLRGLLGAFFVCCGARPSRPL